MRLGGGNDDMVDWSRELEAPAPPPASDAASAPSLQVGGERQSAPAANLPLGSPLDPALAPLPVTQPVFEGETQ